MLAKQVFLPQVGWRHLPGWFIVCWLEPVEVNILSDRPEPAELTWLSFERSCMPIHW